MDIYERKKRWKWILFFGSVFIFVASLYYTSILVEQIRKEERDRVKIWADAIHRKADLVNFTNKLFRGIKDEERKRVRILAEAQKTDPQCIQRRGTELSTSRSSPRTLPSP